MTPERWAEVKRIFDSAVDLPRSDQAAHLHASCGADTDLESEVARLLQAHTESAHLLDEPLAHLHRFLPAVQPAVQDAPRLGPGDLVAARFRVLRYLSRGGMGEVYEALDAELQTPVALKTIRTSIASDPAAIDRFKQEVKHAREVSHPNICRVHELFSQDAPGATRAWFLSMELLVGPTLAERLRRDGPLAAPEALAVARQLIRGLAAAHTVGLVHRDFKSGNVILVPGSAETPERAVITDFGLSSKRLTAAAGTSSPAAGMGTPGYMAPEQEAGGDVGPPADQYALGVVLCEMLTGVLPRWSTSVTQASGEKYTLKLPPGKLPGRWSRVICRCLERDPQKRFSNLDSVLAALDGPRVLRRRAALAVAFLLVIGLICGDVFWLHRDRGCTVCNLAQLTPDTDESESPAISGDGHTVAYSSDRAETGNLDIFLQQLPSGRPVRLTRDPARDGDPSLSADGSLVAFRSERDGGGIYLSDAHGGPERLLAHGGRNPRLSPDGKSVLYWTGDADSFIASGKTYLLSLAPGAHPVQLAADFKDARFPVWSPDGRALLFSGCRAISATAGATLPGCSEWWATSLDGTRVVNTHVLERLRAANILLPFNNVGFWYPGNLLFSAGIGGLRSGLWSIALDEQTWRANSPAREILTDSARDHDPALSTNRTVTYTRLSGALHIWSIEDALRPTRANPSRVTEDPDIDSTPSLAEGGRWLVFARGRGSHRNIWLRDNTTGAESALLTSGLPTQSPIIDSSGQLLAYEQSDLDGPSIYVRNDLKRADAAPRRLCHGCSLPTGWFDHDRAFFYRDGLPSSIWMADPHSGATHAVLGRSGASLDDADWSPANEHLLFTEVVGDHRRIVAVRFPRNTGQPAGEWIVLPERGASPEHGRWSGDGRTVVYTSNSDGFTCIYGWAFSPEKERFLGAPFPIAHFHNGRASIENVFSRSFNLAVDGNSVFFNLGEQTSTVWTGHLKE